MNSWQRNSSPYTKRPYNSKEEALATAIAMITNEVGAPIFFGDDLYEPKKKGKLSF